MFAALLALGLLQQPSAPLRLAAAVDGHPLATAPLHFTAPLLAARALAASGFDVVSLANNHAWDGGRAGLEETMRRLTRAGVVFVGTGFGRPMAEQPVILRRNGWRIAVFAVTRAWNPAPDSFYRHAGADYVAWGDPRGGKPILPSLGNFIFHQTLPWTDLSAIVRVDVAPPPDRTIRVTAVPVRAGFQAQFVTGPAADSVRQRLGVPITLTTAGP